MPKGEHLKGKNSPRVQFSSEYQPENRRQPDSISALLKQELASDGWAVFEDAEILDENQRPTGQKVRVRVKLTTAQAVAKRLLANAEKGRERSIEILLDRTEGKVQQTLNLAAGENLDLLLPKIEISFRPTTDDAPPESEPKEERPKE